MSSSPLVHEKVWADKYKYEDAEKQYFEGLSKQSALTSNSSTTSPEVSSATVTASSTITKPTPIVSKMPAETPPPSVVSTPSVTPVTLTTDSEQDKKKKRRKRNSNSGATTVSAGNGAAVNVNATAGGTTTTPIQETVAKESTGTDKKVKEKKNEASKKGKKQSPEPNKGGSPANPPPPTTTTDEKSSLASEVARARQHIKSSLECVDKISSYTNNPAGGADLINRILSLEKENEGLRQLVEKMQISQNKYESRLNELEKKCSSVTISAPKPGTAKPAAAKPAAKPAKDDDDDMDLFGSDSEEENEAAIKVKEQRVAEYAAKKSNKPILIAKSNVILDVKPWDDETDMKQMEKLVRDIKMDGLLWGASKLVPLAYGIKKLQISSVVEDEKVSIDLLTETIEAMEDFVQSVDIAAFNKI